MVDPSMLPSGLHPVQVSYFEAQATLYSLRKVCQRVFYLDPATGEKKYLSGPKVLLTCLRRTSLGLLWEPGYRGGSDPYLCHDDSQALKDFIVDQAGEMHCITKHQATVAAYLLRVRRQKKAIELLESIGCRETADYMRSETIAEPGPSWINAFCARSQINIRARQSIQQARAAHCNTNAIRTFSKGLRISSIDPLI
jgi:hypothetical protein